MRTVRDRSLAHRGFLLLAYETHTCDRVLTLTACVIVRVCVCKHQNVNNKTERGSFTFVLFSFFTAAGAGFGLAFLAFFLAAP